MKPSGTSRVVAELYELDPYAISRRHICSGTHDCFVYTTKGVILAIPDAIGENINVHAASCTA
jgi:hypothetical protein